MKRLDIGLRNNDHFQRLAQCIGHFQNEALRFPGRMGNQIDKRGDIA